MATHRKITDRQTAENSRYAYLLLFVFFIAFMGEIRMRPFSEFFRFSLSVPALVSVVLIFEVKSAQVYSVLVGAIIFVFRSALMLFSTGLSVEEIFAINRSAFLFYLVFGFMLRLFKIGRTKKSGYTLFLALLICEVTANLSELVSMYSGTSGFELAVTSIVVVGSLRSALAVFICRLFEYLENRYEKKYSEEHYRDMLMFFSRLKSDLLVFKKSMVDVEEATKLSYGLYEKIEDPDLKERSLDVTGRIHDLKKDFGRMFSYMEKNLQTTYRSQSLMLSEIFTVLETFALKAHPGIKISFSYSKDFSVNNYYTLISVINNLLINAAEAFDEERGSRIAISQKSIGQNCIFQVENDGPVIETDAADYIFTPGFSTKFNPETGVVSDGIGLYYVRRIVEDVYGGAVTCDSSVEKTIFTVTVPQIYIEGRRALEP